MERTRHKSTLSNDGGFPDSSEKLTFEFELGKGKLDAEVNDLDFHTSQFASPCSKRITTYSLTYLLAYLLTSLLTQLLTYLTYLTYFTYLTCLAYLTYLAYLAYLTYLT